MDTIMENFKQEFRIFKLYKHYIYPFVKPKMTCRIETLSLISINQSVVVLTSQPLACLVDISSSVNPNSSVNVSKTWQMENYIQYKCKSQ